MACLCLWQSSNFHYQNERLGGDNLSTEDYGLLGRGAETEEPKLFEEAQTKA